MKFFQIFLLSFLITFTGFAQTTFHVSKLDSNLSALYNTDRFNGTVLYAENGKIVYKKAFGVSDFRTNQPLSTNASFNLASVSKQFIAVCVMMLQEQGKLQVDDTINTYFSELPYQNITIRNLLTHTSGIPEYFDIYTQHRNPLDTLTNEMLLQLFVTYKPELEFVPGSTWSYCNTNYALLALLIERISKQSLHDFVEKNITKPLGLKNTYVYHVLMPSKPENYVYGFADINGEKKLNDVYHMDGVVGDGNIYSSVEDLFTWEQSFYTEKLLKQKSIKEIFSPVKLNNDEIYPYGFGWGIEKDNASYSHTGGWVGFSNVICRDVENNRTLIVLSSNSNTTGIDIAWSQFYNQEMEVPKTICIQNVFVIDGTGAPARKASVRIENDMIISVGDLIPFKNEEVIDGNGKILAPGFIDTHSHVDRGLEENPNALPAISQGITTIVVGQDGESDPVDSVRMHSITNPKSVNIATFTGHTTIREMVMGKSNLNRPATQKEIDSINKILTDELNKGSLGLSTGLEYEEGFYSSRDEIIQLAKTTSAANGRYISHLRSEDINLQDALEEIIDIGRQAQIPVQISHIKIALRDDWGSADEIIGMLEQARQEGINITADCYPYTYWNATIRVLFPQKNFTEIEGAQYATEHLFDPDGSVMVRFAPNPEYKGKTISEIASMRKETPEQTLMYLIAVAEAYEKEHPAEYVESIMGKSMSEEDIITFLSWANTNICSDGADGGHPRGYGAFTRVLGYFVREKQIMRLENCIYKMAALSAENVGIKGRGVIAPGFYADLVLFDPETVHDTSNIEDPKAVSEGILMVWVNGVIVYKNKEATNVFPGLFLSK